MNIVSRQSAPEQVAAPAQASPAAPAVKSGAVEGASPTPQAKAQPEEERGRQPVERQQLDKAVAKLNDYVQVVRRELQFSVHDDSGRTVVKVLDRDTGEVVRQIPSEEMLEVVDQLPSDADGGGRPLLFNDLA